jgi:hypothetical protein
MGSSDRGVKIPARFIQPMLLLKTEKLAEGDGWLRELKLDGYRAIAFKTSGKVHLRSRHDRDFARRYLRGAYAKWVDARLSHRAVQGTEGARTLGKDRGWIDQLIAEIVEVLNRRIARTRPIPMTAQDGRDYKPTLLRLHRRGGMRAVVCEVAFVRGEGDL